MAISSIGLPFARPAKGTIPMKIPSLLIWMMFILMADLAGAKVVFLPEQPANGNFIRALPDAILDVSPSGLLSDQV
jgi:hypothetical protein